MSQGRKHKRTIWLGADGQTVEIIDQTVLPHRYEVVGMTTVEDAAHAIAAMQVRGAPLIGITAAYGMALALRQDPGDGNLQAAYDQLLATRPTAINLRWALEEMRRYLLPLSLEDRAEVAYAKAAQLADEDAEMSRQIGQHGLGILKDLAAKKGQGPLNILTHCNAGSLATIEWGTATAPIYAAHNAGLDVHVWVDETRPRNQGAALTAWELQQAGVPHTVIADNVGGHLMQHGMVDVCITGTDRTTASGDVCNKIGTYLKALAARDNDVPFYVALPGSTIDWTLNDGVADIPIEQRDGREVTHLTGRTDDGRLETVDIVSPGSPVANYAFDVTPSRLVTGLITERGVAPSTAAGLLSLYPEQG
ncbi:S-methyl-5-thioribose-1-phosphate isomerase [Rhodovibrionaceae bacterium A322]